MNHYDPAELKKLYIPSADSHKGQNGKLLLIGGSHLFHAASLWALNIASRLVDMVFYSSVPENNQIVLDAKSEFRDGIVVPRTEIERYVAEADCILIGPGMMRAEKEEVAKYESEKMSLQEITALEDEGVQSYLLTRYLLREYPQKKWVIDAGALQMLDPEWLKNLSSDLILTPHAREFAMVFRADATPETIAQKAKEYSCVILVKGQVDIVCSPKDCVNISGGNAGMTKGGTGDVLAGLVAGLACKNDINLAAKAASYINKKAGERLEKRVGLVFNASDLVSEIPFTIKELL